MTIEDERALRRTMNWQVVVIRDFFWRGFLQQVGDELEVTQATARSMIAAALALEAPGWPPITQIRRA